MKTFILRIVPVFVLLGTGVLVANVYAQPGNSYGLISKNISTTNFELPVANEKLSMVILVFDSATCSYEFVGGGEMKLIACHYTSSSASSSKRSATRVVLNNAEMDLRIGSRISEVLNEDVDMEPEMELKEWMMSPGEWTDQ